MKLCIKCNTTKDFSLFYRKTSAKDGHSSYCRDCHKAYDKSDTAKSVRKTYLESKRGNAYTLQSSGKNVCWQKLKRDMVLEEDKKLGFPLDVPAGNFVLAQEPLSPEHRKFIERYEWLGTIGFGVRYVFTARHNGLLGGVVMIAEPNGYQFDKKLEALIQRGACASWTPKNLGSRLVMFACRWMVKNTTKRIFTAYSDPEAGEVGTIYQACNFDYLGDKFGAKEQYWLGKKKVGTRHFTRTGAMKKWAKELGISWQKDWCKPNGFQDKSKIPSDVYTQLMSHAKSKIAKCKKVKVKPKGKYVLLLQNKHDNISKTWIGQPYPKRKEIK